MRSFRLSFWFLWRKKTTKKKKKKTCNDIMADINLHYERADKFVNYHLKNRKNEGWGAITTMWGNFIYGIYLRAYLLTSTSPTMLPPKHDPVLWQ